MQFEAFELTRMDHAGSDQPDGATGDQVEPVACGQSPFAAGSTALVAATGAGLNTGNWKKGGLGVVSMGHAGVAPTVSAASAPGVEERRLYGKMPTG